MIKKNLYFNAPTEWKYKYTQYKLYPLRWSFLTSQCFQRTVLRDTTMSKYSNKDVNLGNSMTWLRWPAHDWLRTLSGKASSFQDNANVVANSNKITVFSLRKVGMLENFLMLTPGMSVPFIFQFRCQDSRWIRPKLNLMRWLNEDSDRWIPSVIWNVSSFVQNFNRCSVSWHSKASTPLLCPFFLQIPPEMSEVDRRGKCHHGSTGGWTGQCFVRYANKIINYFSVFDLSVVNGVTARGMKVFAEVQNAVAARLVYGGDFVELFVFWVNGCRGMSRDSLLMTMSDLIWSIMSFLGVDGTVKEYLNEIFDMSYTIKLTTKINATHITSQKLEIILRGKKFVAVSINKFFHEFWWTVRCDSRLIERHVETGWDFCNCSLGRKGSLIVRVIGVLSSQNRSCLVRQNVVCFALNHVLVQLRQWQCERGLRYIGVGRVWHWDWLFQCTC